MAGMHTAVVGAGRTSFAVFQAHQRRNNQRALAQRMGPVEARSRKPIEPINLCKTIPLIPISKIALALGKNRLDTCRTRPVRSPDNGQFAASFSKLADIKRILQTVQGRENPVQPSPPSELLHLQYHLGLVMSGEITSLLSKAGHSGSRSHPPMQLSIPNFSGIQEGCHTHAWSPGASPVPVPRLHSQHEEIDYGSSVGSRVSGLCNQLAA